MFDPVAIIIFSLVATATLALGLWIWCRQEKKRDLRGLQWASAVAVQVQPVSETRRARVVPPLSMKETADAILYEKVCVLNRWWPQQSGFLRSPTRIRLRWSLNVQTGLRCLKS